MSNLPYTIHNGNSLEVLKTLEDKSIDSIVCDPPYELGFMNKKWDSTGIAYNVELWKECFRVLKPGGHVLAFSGSRTYHRMAVAIEDAGFDIRDQIMWVFSTGFPKNHDVSKNIDKMAGAEREVIESIFRGNNAGKKNGIMGQTLPRIDKITVPATEKAKQWEGWGTALKPAHEPICLARKPFDRTVAENVLLHGTGAINIDGCRIELSENDDSRLGGKGEWKTDKAAKNVYSGGYAGDNISSSPLGRFPANIIHDGSEEVVSLFPNTSPSKAANRGLQHSSRHGGIRDIGGNIKEGTDSIRGHNDKGGSAARFFYCAKASKRDRDEGLDGFEERVNPKLCDTGYESPMRMDGKPCAKYGNHHPTVKPTTLMQYLCRLITLTNGIVLDPFMGSGSTGKAAMYEGFRFIGIDLDAEYCEIAKARIEFAIQDKDRPNKKDKEKEKKQKSVKQSDITTKSLW